MATTAKTQKKSNKSAQKHERSSFLFSDALIERAGDWRIALALSATYTVVLLWAAHVYHRVGDYGVETDFFWNYAPDARTIQAILKGEGGAFPIDGFRGPMYALVLACVAFIIQDFFAAGVIFGIFCAGATLFLTHRLVLEFFGKIEALVVLLILATNSIFIQYSYSAGTDMFFNLVATLAVYAFLKALSIDGWRWLLVASLASGVALLTRQNSLFLIVGFLLALFLFNPSKQSLKVQVLYALTIIAVVFALYAPYGFYTLQEKGKFFYSLNYLNIAKDLFGRETNWDTFWYGKSQSFTSLGDVILADPVKFIANTLANIPAHFIGDMGELMSWFLGVFVIGGIVAILVQRNLTRVQVAYFIFAVLNFGVLLLTFYGARFSLNLIAPYAVLAVLFFKWEAVPKVAHYALPIALAIMLFQSVQFHRKNIDSGPQEMLALREKFFAITGRNPNTHYKEIIITRKPHIAYYLNLNMGGFPMAETYDELIAEARKLGATYLFYSYFEANLRPQFRFLFNAKEPPPELEPIMTLANPPAVLYRIKPLPSDTTK
ncbi:MAG: glycosyltransferase family 39 protein [Chloroherpetonaceae bacterium]